MKSITKIILVLLLCLLHSTQIFAQKQVGIINQKLRKTNATQIFMVADSTKSNFSILLHDRDSIYAYLLDNQYNIKKKVSKETSIYENIQNLGELVASQYEGEGVYAMLFYESKNEEFVWVTINYTKGLISSTKSFSYRYNKLKQIYIGVITYKNIPYAITINYDKTNFYAHKLSRTGESEVISFQPLDKAYDKVFEYRKGIGAKAKIEYTMPTNLHLASKPNKLYVVSNKIYLSADRKSEYNYNNDGYNANISPSEHYDFIMDLETLKVNVIKTHLNSIKATGINSFIYDEKLYLVGVTKEVFELNIIALKDRQLLKKYTFNSLENISFANSQIFKDNGETGTDLTELKDAKKFLNKIDDKVAISVNQINENQVELKIGYYEEVTGGGYTVGAGTVTGGFGAAPIMMGTGAGSNGSYCGYFKTHLDLTTGEYIKRDNQTTVFSKYTAFKENLENTKVYGNKGTMVKIKPTAILCYFNNNNLIYGYYDNVSEVYKLIEFKDGN
jgi:hypothetical protein